MSGNSAPSTSNTVVTQDGTTVADPSHASSGTVAGLANILVQSVAATVGGRCLENYFETFLVYVY
jgi:hypothetical protein